MGPPKKIAEAYMGKPGMLIDSIYRYLLADNQDSGDSVSGRSDLDRYHIRA